MTSALHNVPDALLLPLLLCTLTGCTESKTVDNEVSAFMYGEEFIEEGIPADSVADGWSVTFESFMVKASDVTIAGEKLPEAPAIDLAHSSQGEGHLYSTTRVPVGDYDGSSYTLSDIRVKGVATKGELTKSFDWTLETTTRYTGCETTTRVTEAKPGAFQITVHADHLLYDSLVSSEPEVKFQQIADADTDADQVITRAELELAGIGPYDPGSEADVKNMWSWLEAQSTTLGHVDGEGHCDAAFIK